MKTSAKLFPAAIGAFITLSGVAALHGQNVVQVGLASFPIGTSRFEYSHPAKLRELPHYSSLHQRYLGPRLRSIEDSLSQLGVQERDVDEIVLGWRPEGAGLDFYGLAAGHFNPQVVGDERAGRGLTPIAILGQQAYCFGPDAGPTCILVLGPTLGAFGAPKSLQALVEARSGSSTSLASDQEFSKRVEEARQMGRQARTDAPVWGVAVGAAVPDWFKGWMPNQGSLQLDWTQTFKGVRALAYSVEAAEKVRLSVKLDCATNDEAGRLRQVLEGLRMFQQLLWQNQYPGRPNPFESLELDVSGRAVLMKLVTSYAELAAR